MAATTTTTANRSEKLKEIGQRFLDAFIGRRNDELLSLFVSHRGADVPAFHFYGPPEFPLFRSWRGISGLREMFTLIDLLMDSNFELQDIFAETPDSRSGAPSPYQHVIIRLREFGRMKNTSKLYDSITVFVLDITEDDLIAQVHEHSNTYTICRAYIK
eukprot:TRINITY_DN11834_c0_g1_i1.p1 TRINITY_DN11834_c0_g1~~TRINITY_DN11834_c0_g1_i1.p1  ORF type:complete len:159 (-),score=16.95 TRINITY_DN11834_c0_g1_i1:32-508(-)